MNISNITNLQVNSDTENTIERSLRPNNFGEVIGRELEKKSLKIMIESAKKRSKALDHVLFHGPPGLGKTSLANVVAKEMGVSFQVTSGSAIDKGGDLAAILTSLEPYSILFIDEIHRLKKSIEEILYPAMEDKVLDIVIGKGPSARTIRIDLPEFTIIGATTKLSMLSSPLRDRFGMNFRLDFYSEEEIMQQLFQKAEMLNIGIEDYAAEEIAKRSRMTSRIAIRILKRVRDMVIVEGTDKIKKNHVTETLKLFGIDEFGLDSTDRKIIFSLYNNFSNKPVGLNTLAASISEEPDTVENVYEPYLLKRGLIQRTPRGRVVTQKAIDIYNSLFTNNQELYNLL